MKFMPLYLVLALLSLPLAAQNAGGPALGATASADGRSVQLIQGVPGASRFGQSAQLPSDLRLLQLSPAAAMGIASTVDTGWPLLYDIASGARTTLNGARQNPATVTWSPLGSAFALAYPADRRLQIFSRGDSGSYQFTDDFTLDGPVAVSDDGGAVLLASGGTLALRTAGGFETLAVGVNAFTFLAGSRTVAYATSTGLTVGSSRIARPVKADPILYLGSPARDRLVALRASGSAMIFDANGNTLVAENCGAPATGLDSLGRAGSLVMSTKNQVTSPLCVADASDNARIYFIPPPPQNTGADQ